MEIQGERLLAVPQGDVWRALNDPAVLQRCLAGCDTFEADGDNRYRVVMQATVGPVRARFAGKLQLLDVLAPNSYALAFEGSGGVAGFGKGTAKVNLEETREGTRLSYAAQAQVGGRLAQVGARLIDGVTKRMADDFFSRFVRELPAKERGPQEGAERESTSAPARSASPHVLSPVRMPPAAHVVAPTASSQSSLIAVVAAAVAATAAAVAVLAAMFVVQFAR